MCFCNQTRWLCPSQIVFAALQNIRLRWGARIQAANQTCTHQPFLPKVGRNTLIHDSFFVFLFLHWPLLKEILFWSVVSSSHFHVFNREQPVMWGVEVSSGHGPREVRTCLQFSDQPLVDHVFFKIGVFFFSILIPNRIHVTYCWKHRKYLLSFFFFSDLPNETVNGDNEEPAFFSTMVCCSLVNFSWTEAEHKQLWRCLLPVW